MHQPLNPVLQGSFNEQPSTRTSLQLLYDILVPGVLVDQNSPELQSLGLTPLQLSNNLGVLCRRKGLLERKPNPDPQGERFSYWRKDSQPYSRKEHTVQEHTISTSSTVDLSAAAAMLTQFGENREEALQLLGELDRITRRLGELLK